MFKSARPKNILSYFVPFLMLIILIMPLLVSAQTDEGGAGGDEGGAGKNIPPIKIVIANPFKMNTIEGLIKTIVDDILMPVGGVVAVMMIMYAGFLYVTGRGDPGQIKKAHDALLWAVIGAAILLGAWAISQAIGTTIDQLRA